MENKDLNQVQITALVGRLLAQRQFDELGALAHQDERVLDQLVETMRDTRGPFGFFAATALSKAGAPAVPPLLEALEDEQYPVRQVAALALGEIGDARAMAGLMESLRDRHEAVRQAGAVSLGKLRATEAVDALLAALNDEAEIVRRAAVNALGMIGDERSLQALHRVQAEDTQAVAQRAREVIRQIQERGT